MNSNQGKISALSERLNVVARSLPTPKIGDKVSADYFLTCELTPMIDYFADPAAASAELKDAALRAERGAYWRRARGVDMDVVLKIELATNATHGIDQIRFFTSGETTYRRRCEILISNRTRRLVHKAIRMMEKRVNMPLAYPMAYKSVTTT
jgi:hypothetical protein